MRQTNPNLSLGCFWACAYLHKNYNLQAARPPRETHRRAKTHVRRFKTQLVAAECKEIPGKSGAWRLEGRISLEAFAGGGMVKLERRSWSFKKCHPVQGETDIFLANPKS